MLAMNDVRLLDDGGKGKDPGALRDVLRAAGLRGPGHGKGGIRCPRCAWRPRATSRWGCDCGHVWNTFDTRGRCPGCGHQWQVTACLSCHAFAPHEAWYEREGSCRS